MSFLNLRGRFFDVKTKIFIEANPLLSPFPNPRARTSLIRINKYRMNTRVWLKHWLNGVVKHWLNSVTFNVRV